LPPTPQSRLAYLTPATRSSAATAPSSAQEQLKRRGPGRPKGSKNKPKLGDRVSKPLAQKKSQASRHAEHILGRTRGTPDHLTEHASSISDEEATVHGSNHSPAEGWELV
jgi:hypothetical protein